MSDKKNNNRSALDENDVRKWTSEDIDKLLDNTKRSSEIYGDSDDNQATLLKRANSAKTKHIDLSEPPVNKKDERIMDIMDGKAEDDAKTEKRKKKFSDLFSAGRLSKMSEIVDDDSEDDFDDEFENDYLTFGTKKEQDSSDEERTRIIPVETVVAENIPIYEEDDSKTRTDIQSAASPKDKPGVNKNNIDKNSDEAESKSVSDMNFETETDSENSGEQIMLDGFENIAETPSHIDEAKAERDLFEKRREKIRNFTLFSEDENGDLYSSDEQAEKIGELFETGETRQNKIEAEEDFNGVEYKQPKDAKLVLRYMLEQRKKSVSRLFSYGALLALSIIVGAVTAIKSSIGGDKIITIFINLILSAAAILIANQTLITSFVKLKKKTVNCETAASLAAIIGFLQNVLMLVLYFTGGNTVSVFSGVGIAALFINELNRFNMLERTLGAIKLTTGKRKDRLYAIEGPTDDKDAFELGKYVKTSGSRIKFSCKTKFPSHLVELCTSPTSADNKMKFLIPITLVLSAVNAVVAGIINSDIAVGAAAFSVTACLCLPAWSALLFQMPLKWMNGRLSKCGSMISSQKSAEEICRINTIVIDSRDLFDKNACSILDIRDYGTVRVDDAILYATAMVIKSVGPLSYAFDSMVSSRHDFLPTVKSFNYEEKLGVSGWINNQKVLLGNRDLMMNHNIEIPDDGDEERYNKKGLDVLYLAIAHRPAAMIVVKYAPNKAILPYLKKLHASGLNILVRNNDPNITEKMISASYGMRLDNIKIISNASGRIIKKYKSRPKIATRASSLHDGTVYSFLKTICSAAELRRTFKFSDMMIWVGIFLFFGVVLTLGAMKALADMPSVFATLIYLIVSLSFVGALKIIAKKY
ncbi:MAG: hypothetical protein PUB20_04265 [Clostridia bacterium]|nr:hypothetical protein [Clostridia bacterium]